MNTRIETTRCLSLLALVCAAGAQAQDVEPVPVAAAWTGAASSTWSDAGNWNPGVPGATDTAVFNDPDAPAARVTTDTTIAGMQLDTTPSLSLPSKAELYVTGPVTGTGGIRLTGDNTGTWGDNGRLELQSSSNTFEGDVEITGGTVRFTKVTANSALFAGTVLINGGTFSFAPTEIPVNTSGAPQTAGNRTFTNLLKVGATGGRAHMNGGSGANDMSVVYGDIELGGPLAMASAGGGNSYGYTIDGTVTILQDSERTTRISNETGHNGEDYISGNFVDGPGDAGNPLRLKTAGKKLNITGLSSTYAGGTVFEATGASPIVVHPCASLGTGNVVGETGTHTLIQNLAPLGEPCSLAPDATINVQPGAAIGSGTGTVKVKGTRTSGSPVITFTGTASTVDMFAGQTVTGTGIPEETTIASIDSHTQITLSQSATSDGTSEYTFAGRALDATSRFSADSAGIYGVDIATHTYDLDQSGMGNGAMFVGTVLGGTYAGHFSPGAGNAIRVGGGESTDILSSSGGNALTVSANGAFSGDASVIVGAGAEVGGASRGYVLVTGDNSHTGGTFVNDGAALMIGKTGGTPLGTGHVYVRNGGILGASSPNGSFTDGTKQFSNYSLLPGAVLLLSDQLPQSTTYSGSNGGQGRWGDSADMELVDNMLYIHAGKNCTTYETAGAFRFADFTRVNFADGGGTSRFLLTVDTIERVGGGLFMCNSKSLGTASRLRTVAGSELAITNGIVAPYMLDGGNNNFLTYDTAEDSLGVIGLKPLATYVALASAGPNDVATVAGTTLSADVNVYALKVTGEVTGTGRTITLGSGGFINTKSSKKFEPNLDFSATEGVLCLSADLTIKGSVTAPNGLIKCGGANAKLSGSANDIQGRIFVAQGTLQLENNEAAADWSDCDMVLSTSGTVNQNNKAVSVRSLSGSGTVQNGTMTVTEAFNPGGSRYPGKLTTGGLVLGPECATTFRVGTESDAVKVNGDLTLGGTVCAEIADGFAPGTYTVMTYTGTLTNAGVRRGFSETGLSARLDTTEPGVVKLVVDKGGRTLILLR